MLPSEPPFVLECDREKVSAYNEKQGRNPAHLLRLEYLPEPFLGAPEAPVVLLSNNPGYGKRAHLKLSDEFRVRMRCNLRHGPSNHPFLYLDPALKEVGHWWRIKSRILRERFGDEVIARSFLNIVFFPYTSKNFAHGKVAVPSQQYGFQLVRSALERKAAIISMRPGKNHYWLQVVPALSQYNQFFSVNNPQNPAISPGNLPQAGYKAIVEAIETAERRRRGS
jgi:hypothetical protein